MIDACARSSLCYLMRYGLLKNLEYNEWLPRRRICVHLLAMGEGERTTKLIVITVAKTVLASVRIMLHPLNSSVRFSYVIPRKLRWQRETLNRCSHPPIPSFFFQTVFIDKARLSKAAHFYLNNRRHAQIEAGHTLGVQLRGKAPPISWYKSRPS